MECFVPVRHRDASDAPHLMVMFLDFFLDAILLFLVQLLGHAVSDLKSSLSWPPAFGIFECSGLPRVFDTVLKLCILEQV